MLNQSLKYVFSYSFNTSLKKKKKYPNCIYKWRWLDNVAFVFRNCGTMLLQDYQNFPSWIMTADVTSLVIFLVTLQFCAGNRCWIIRFFTEMWLYILLKIRTYYPWAFLFLCRCPSNNTGEKTVVDRFAGRRTFSTPRN